MKRSYSQKSGDCPDGFIERTASKPRSAKAASVRLKSRPSPKPLGRSRITTRETQARGRPRHNRPHQPRTTKAREPGKRLAAAQLASRTVHERFRPTRETMPTSGRDFIGQFLSADHAPTVNPSDPDRSDSATTQLSGRSSRRPSQRRGRPEALFEAQTHVFKPGLTLAASRKT
ncbi:unnamed protein product [Microthlaspi erraticum]|uniref:Uncharacterized protein n=1 Tax=Microthlaspi erraticum TaxID=1685480 RepID=A0A6D2IV51_9BRAS|nr:unnamed protein product [Microthlaspi erraticum]